MDKTFHEVQAKVAKRLIHSDRHRRRKSIAPEIVICNSKNHDLSRLMVKNEVLFKSLENKMSSLEQEQRKRQSELSRTERALAGSMKSRSGKRGLPNLVNKVSSQKGRESRSSGLREPRRNSLIEDKLSSSNSTNQLVQKWLQSFGPPSNNGGNNTLQVPSFLHPEEDLKSGHFGSEAVDRNSGLEVNGDLESDEISSTSTFHETDRASSRQSGGRQTSLSTAFAKIRISSAQNGEKKLS